jgi:hypothetical protein
VAAIHAFGTAEHQQLIAVDPVNLYPPAGPSQATPMARFLVLDAVSDTFPLACRQAMAAPKLESGSFESLEKRWAVVRDHSQGPCGKSLADQKPQTITPCSQLVRYGSKASTSTISSGTNEEQAVSATMRD